MGMEDRLKRLFTIDSADRVRVWDVCILDEPAGIAYRDGLKTGKLKDWISKAAKPMNVGKANETTVEQQAVLMMEAEIGIKLRNNYFHTEAEARSNKLFLPMLAEKYEKRAAKLKYPLYVQPKYDGSRANVYYSKAEGRVVMMSRTGKEVVSCPHIVESLTNYCTANPTHIIDGELYNHALRNDFEQLMSLSRKTRPTEEDLQKSATMLKLYVYDIYDTAQSQLTFSERNAIIVYKLTWSIKDSIEISYTTAVSTTEELLAMEETYLADGYEGIMVRVPSSVYKVDGRSADLLKKKIFTDEEFEIIDIFEGDSTWKGCAKTVMIILPDGKIQGAGLKGTFEVNRERLENKADLIGKLATVCYFGKTSDGLLRFPICKDIDRFSHE
jgi:ATP-dependent DNA ligase